MKHTFITTVSEGYMFALNCNFNSNKFYGTNADFVILYNSSITPDYMHKCSKAFPFNIFWFPIDDFGTYHTAKYEFAKQNCLDYDSVCLIDADLFICRNVSEHFEKAAKEDVLISATHVWSGGDINHLDFGNPDIIVDRGRCQLADFPVFINPNKHTQLFEDWINRCNLDYSKEISHPLVSFNRAVCRNFKKEQIIPLDGHLWVCDQNYWDVEYIPDYTIGIMLNSIGERICAIHNKWWKLGRSSGEWLAHKKVSINPTVAERLDRGERNFNAIRDFMAWFNNMTPETKRNDFFQGRHDWRKFLEEHK